MARYRKKPVVIDAVQLPIATAPAWFADAMDDGQVLLFADGTARVPTLEGDMAAQPGDWIIRGVQGELYPCKPAIFEKTYEFVED